MMMNSSRIIRPNAGFILPGSRYFDVELPQAKVAVAGRFKLRKHRPDARGRSIILQETPWFDNIILDSGLNRWGTATVIFGAAIGTGTAVPDASQTQLQALTHYTTTTGTGHNVHANQGVSPYAGSTIYVFRTTLGALNGNYSEVGVGWAAANMFSRALILDGVGAPTTIAVGAAEQLDIMYQAAVFPPLVDYAPAPITISGVSYTVTGRGAFVTANSWGFNEALWGVGASNSVYTGAIGAITAAPAGTTGSGISSQVQATYVNNSNALQQTITWGLTVGNTVSNTIRSVIANWRTIYGATFQYEFNPVIPKDSTKTLVLNYGITWARRP
jgi:hypothetical protein